MILTVWICYVSTEQNHMKKVNGVWPGNTTINPVHHEEEMQSITSHMTLNGNFKQPALSSRSEMIAKLEMTLCYAQQNKDKTPTNDCSNNKQ